LDSRLRGNDRKKNPGISDNDPRSLKRTTAGKQSPCWGRKGKQGIRKKRDLIDPQRNWGLTEKEKERIK